MNLCNVKIPFCAPNPILQQNNKETLQHLTEQQDSIPVVFSQIILKVMFCLQKKNINQQFALPERKAKVEQIVKTIENVDNPDTRYCICRSTDGTRFMM